MFMTLELLAPAGSPASLKAAVAAGADSVYLGSEWNARMRARNFTADEMLQALAFCRKSGVGSYVTLNTLAFENELPRILEYIERLYEYGADALIIQDLGIAKLAHDAVPGLALHASTQLSTHNSKSAKILKGMGFSRIVLARELSLERAKAIKENAGIEVEVFAHGAMCYSYSGKCLFSQIQVGRSGNRGSCAQICRFPWRLFQGKKEVRRGYLTSPKDLNTLAKIPEIAKSGISCVKIEGRLKGAEYVRAIVGAYRRAIDKGEKTDLNKLTTRAYTGGYLFSDAKNANFTNPDSSGFLGEKIGEVLSTGGTGAIVRLFGTLSAGDSIRTLKSGKIIELFRVYQKKREVASATGECELRIRTLAKGDVIYKVERASIEDDFLKNIRTVQIRKVAHYSIPKGIPEFAVHNMNFCTTFEEALACPSGSRATVRLYDATEENLAKLHASGIIPVIDTPRVAFDSELGALSERMDALGKDTEFLASELAFAEGRKVVLSQYANVSNTLSAKAWAGICDVQGVVSAMELPQPAAESLGFMHYNGKEIELMISENDLFKELGIGENEGYNLMDPKGNRFSIRRRDGRTVIIKKL
jgi:collagenase-like PrtC family protease